MSKLTKPDGLHWRDFEHLCLILFERYYDAPDANFYGTRETGQHGIDIRLTTVKGGVPARVVVQCKVRESMTWSVVSQDVKTALRKFARLTIAEGRKLRYIVATTAEGADHDTMETQLKELIAQLGMADIEKHIEFDVYPWPRLEDIGQFDPALAGLMKRPDRVADQSSTQSLNQLVTEVADSTRANRLGAAFKALTDYLRSAKPDKPENFDWAPTALFDSLADLFLSAGDFVHAEKLLDTALGSQKFNAKYLLGYLRAKRVLHRVRLHNGRSVDPFNLTPAPSPVEEHVRNLAPQLLKALGDVDDQLTLMLWIVTYATDQRLVDQALQRALNLVTLAWPEKVERLAANDVYVFSQDGYLDREPVMFTPRMAASDDHDRACALAAAYTYIRAIYGARFSADEFRHVEAGQDGWPLVIHNLGGSNPFSFFSTMNPLCARATLRYLPALFAEGSGREFDWMPSDGVSDDRPAPRAGVYVATPEFLLRDCIMKVVALRIDALSSGGIMGGPATIMISHLGMERLIQAHVGFSLEFTTQGMLGAQSGPIADAIDTVLAHLMRYESQVHVRDMEIRPFASQPCYANYGRNRRGDSLDASLHLSKARNAPFLATTLGEYHLAGAALPQYAKRFMYWLPQRFAVGSIAT